MNIKVLNRRDFGRSVLIGGGAAALGACGATAGRQGQAGGATRTTAQYCEELSRASGGGEYRAEELRPTASWWIKVGGTFVAKIVSLESITGLPGPPNEIPAPGDPWEANKEHWFAPPAASAADLHQLLPTAGASSPLTLTRAVRGMGPALHQEMSDIVNGGWGEMFRASPRLQESHWRSKSVSCGCGTPGYYFKEGATAPGEEYRAYLYLEPMTSDGSRHKLLRATWWATSPHCGFDRDFQMTYQGNQLPPQEERPEYWYQNPEPQ